MGSKSKTLTNTASRRQALQAMFQQEFCGLDLSALDAGSKDLLVVSFCPKGVQDTELVGEPLNDYAKELISGIIANQEEIDSWISAAADNWAIERMQNVDRNIIRLACYELAFVGEIPTPVAINEAVEVAKVFGGDESPKFVNGVLGRIAKKLAEDGRILDNELTQTQQSADQDADAADQTDADAADQADAAVASEVEDAE